MIQLAHYSEQLETLPGLLFSYARPPVPDRQPDAATLGSRRMAESIFWPRTYSNSPVHGHRARTILEGDPNGIVLILEGHDPTWKIYAGAFPSPSVHMPIALPFCLDRAMTISCGCSPCQTSVSTASRFAVAIPHINHSWYACGHNAKRPVKRTGQPRDLLPHGFNDLVARDPPQLRPNRSITWPDLDRRRAVEARLERECDNIFDDPTFLMRPKNFS